MINDTRRKFLKVTVSGTAISALTISGLTLPSLVIAKSISKAFESDSLEKVLNELFESSKTIESDQISIIAPSIVENVSVVPVTIRSDLQNIQSISVIAEKNPNPLVANYEFDAGVAGHVSTRIKLGKTQDVWAVVKSNGNLYTAKTEVKVTVGGCGG